MLSAYLRACGVTDDTAWRELWTRLNGRSPATVAGPVPEPYAGGGGPGAVYVPETPTSFVGRAREVGRAHELLATTRLLTLTGLGGVGKTRLAQQVARTAALHHRDGARWVELSEVAGPGSVVLQTLAALGEVTAPGTRPLTGLVELLRDRNLLLVLDNCEHALAPTAEVVAGVLRHAPGVTVLATSRRPLGVGGEHLYEVLPLPLTTGPGGALDLLGARARAILPGLDWNSRDQECAQRICRRLDGVPLALEITARRLRFLSPAQLLSRLDSGLRDARDLRNADPAAPRRHSSMRAVLDWSHELCSPEEQWAWAAFSVFVGQVEPDAAEAVCAPVRAAGTAAGTAGGAAGGAALTTEAARGPSSATGTGPSSVTAAGATLDALAGLVDHSVLTAVRMPDGSHRLTMLDSVREYGRSRLAERGRTALVQGRHLAWWVRFARRACERWHGAGQAELIKAVRAELTHLRRAVEYGLVESTDPAAARAALELVADLWWHCVAAGSLDEGRRWTARALERTADPSRGLAPDRSRTRVLWMGAYLDAICGDMRAAMRGAGTAASRARRSGDTGALAWSLLVQGLVRLLRGETDRAVALTERSLAQFRTTGDPEGLQYAHNQLGTAYGQAGDTDRALTHLTDALEVARRTGEEWHRGYILWSVSVVRLDRGETGAAREVLAEALTGRHRFPGRRCPAMLLDAVVRCALAEGRSLREAAVLHAATAAIWPGGAESLLFAFRAVVDRREESRAALRNALGAEALAAAEAEGAALTPVEAMERAARHCAAETL
ncbi:ATP-binding protein [Streptomyces sp. NPDC002164]|uniref:ATP-binding protein n=1 Tax=Streptomyces sp. NPDC002164 TaxID=3364633 RepID=UPI0036753785